MLRWLSLFPAVRRLMADFEEVTKEVLILQDRLQQTLNNHERIWQQMIESRKAENAAHQMLINIEYQRHYGIVPFPDAVKLPPSTEKGGPVAPRMSPSQAIEQQTERMIRELTSRTGVNG